jgi:hypothetical protein
MTSGSYDKTTGAVAVAGTRPTNTPVTASVPGDSKTDTGAGGTWSISLTVPAPRPDQVPVDISGDGKAFTVRLAGAKITDPDDPGSVKVTVTHLAGADLDLKGTRAAAVTGMSVAVAGGGGNATFGAGDKWSFDDTLNPAPTGPYDVTLTATTASGNRVMDLTLNGSSITAVGVG